MYARSAPTRGRLRSRLLRVVKTYTCQLAAAVTALGAGTLLLGVEVSVLATRRLDHADLVANRVVRLPSPL